MIVSEEVKNVSSFALLLFLVFGWPLVNLFPPSTAERVLALLFVFIVGTGSLYISIFAKTEKVWCFSANKAANCPHCGGAVIADIYINPERRRVESLELIDFSLYQPKPKEGPV